MTSVLEAFGEPISFGGQESFVMGAISHMNQDKFRFDLLTPYYCDNASHQAWIEKHGGEVYELGVDFNPGGDRSGILAPVSAFFEEHHYDVVHIHSGSTSVLALLAKASKEQGTPLVITHSHSPVEHFTLKNWLIREICSWSIEKNADMLCACSGNAAEAKYAPRLQGRVKLIKNGINLAKFTYRSDVRGRVREELGLTVDAYVIGHVGRFCYEKNHAYLIDVFCKVWKADSSAVLLLVGAGETMQAVKEQVASLGLQDAVIFTGATDDVSGILQAMDVFAFPSRYEALPVSLVEAQAAGLPVVVSDRVTDEVKVSDRFYQLPIKAENQVDWVKAIESLRGTPRFDGTSMAKASGFDVESVASELSWLYLHGEA